MTALNPIMRIVSKDKIVELKSSAELFASPERPYTEALLAAVPGRARS
jgi:peptide/nickel transport system ATP-binding protein